MAPASEDPVEGDPKGRLNQVTQGDRVHRPGKAETAGGSGDHGRQGWVSLTAARVADC